MPSDSPQQIPTDRVAVIDAWLPQTQCTRCGYPNCRAYAEAIAQDAAAINRCPPGRETTLTGLARLLKRPYLPLDPAYGPHTPRVRAEIDEAVCIGCRKCLEVCPVDAIVGAHRLMHSVIASECTGCELCLPPCPVDCIRLVPVAVAPQAGRWPDYTDEERHGPGTGVNNGWRAMRAGGYNRRPRLMRPACARTARKKPRSGTRSRASVKTPARRLQSPSKSDA